MSVCCVTCHTLSWRERARSPGVRGQLAAGRLSAGLCYMSYSECVSMLIVLKTNTHLMCLCVYIKSVCVVSS